MSEPDDVVIQVRCLYCGAEHYGPAVDAISHGEESCGSCGRTPPVFRDRAAYRKARQEQLLYRERPRSDPDTGSDLLRGLHGQQNEWEDS